MGRIARRVTRDRLGRTSRMSRLVRGLGGVLLWLGTTACADDGEPDPAVSDATLQARAGSYRTLEAINAVPFATGAHQGRPLVTIWTDALAAPIYRELPAEPDLVPFPEGSMIIKEMLDPDGGDSILTVMAKREPGYDPDNGDWWYGRLTASGASTGEGLVGRVGFCIDCHARAATDHVYGIPP